MLTSLQYSSTIIYSFHAYNLYIYHSLFCNTPMSIYMMTYTTRLRHFVSHENLAGRDILASHFDLMFLFET